MQGANSKNSFRILLVEDSPSDAALLQENILLGGVKDTCVSVAQSLHEAVDYLKNNHVDAVLLDLTLPDSSGLDTVREISRIAPDLPVVVLTGIDDEKTGTEAVRMGVQDYLVKGRADGRIILRAIRYSIERKQMDNALRQARDELEKKVQERTAEIAQTVVILRRQQTRDAVTRVLLELFAQKTSMTDYLDSVVKIIRTWSGCRCVGIRLTDAEGYIPYESCVGFSEEFVSAESRLCLGKDVCACIRVVAQAPDPQDAGVMTDKGSFRCDDTFGFIDSLTPGEKARYRGNCLKHGFASVAVVPIRYRDRIFGAVHLADEQPNKVPLESVRFLENMAGLIGEAVHRFRVEQALRLSESRLVEAQRIAHLGNWDWDIVKNTLWWSDEVYRIFGLQPQQFGATYEAFLCHVHADDRERVKAAVNEALHSHRPYSIDHRVVRPDGSQRIVHERAEVFYDLQNKPIRMMGTVQDVTELKQAEARILADQMALRSLTSELQLAEERERRRIAGDLHDSIGQILAMSKWELVRLQKSSPAKIATSLNEVANQLDQAVKQARTLSFELSPSVLYDLGFEVALEDLAERFSRERKIACHFQDSGGPKPLTDAVKVLLYRSVRELLMNVVKHANAATAKISLVRIDNELHITVEDNGDGFDVSILDGQPGRQKGFGVLSIRERLRHIGGRFEIQSTSGNGTKVTLVAPLGTEKSIGQEKL
jgi:PAS domain S-box-containing protein